MSTPTSEPPSMAADVAHGEDMQPTATPTERVFTITELCETILGHLSVHDLVSVQRVSHIFKNAIAGSATLQRQLFFKPDPSADQGPWILTADSHLFAGPRASALVHYMKKFDAEPRSVRPLAYNPLMFSTRNSDRGLFAAADCFLDFPNSCWTAIHLRDQVDVLAIPDHASCHSMQVSQPPCTEVVIEISGKRKHVSWEDDCGMPEWYVGKVASRTIMSTSGVTVGQVLAIAKQAMQGYEEAGLSAIRFVDGFAVGVEQKTFVEQAVEVTKRNDPWSRRVSGRK